MNTPCRISFGVRCRRTSSCTPGGVGAGTALSVALLLVMACGGDAGKPFGADGTGGDGALGSGGHPGSGGHAEGTGGGPSGTGGAPDTGSGGSGGGSIGSGGQSPGTGGAGATSTGGTSTGGKVGAGGNASGGRPGTGGGTGPGGNPGSGTGGKSVGTGGSAGTGGHGGVAGTGGAGGTGGDPAVVCNDLVTAYSNELQNAKLCSTTAKGACGIKVSRSISCPGCQTFVNDDTQLKVIIAKWQAGGCDKVPRACPAIACLAITDAVCKAGTNGTDGTCADNSGVLTPGPVTTTTTASAAAE